MITIDYTLPGSFYDLSNLSIARLVDGRHIIQLPQADVIRDGKKKAVEIIYNSLENKDSKYVINLKYNEIYLLDHNGNSIVVKGMLLDQLSLWVSYDKGLDFDTREGAKGLIRNLIINN